MTYNIHELKIFPKYFDAVVSGDKTFEVRRNDRDFNVGDILNLMEFDGSSYSGNNVLVKITYILNDRTYCKDDYVILGIKKI